MKNRSTKDISLATVFAVLYAVTVIGLALISFDIFQVRIGDALLALSIILGWFAITGIRIAACAGRKFYCYTSSAHMHVNAKLK